MSLALETRVLLQDLLSKPETKKSPSLFHLTKQRPGHQILRMLFLTDRFYWQVVGNAETIYIPDCIQNHSIDITVLDEGRKQ